MGAFVTVPPRILKFLLSLVSVVVSLAVLEGYVRIRHMAPDVYRFAVDMPVSPLRFPSHPGLPYEYKPLFVPQNDPGATVKTNSMGFRDIEHAAERRNPSVRRIFFMDSSIMDGNFSESLFDKKLGIYNIEDLLPTQVGKKLGPEKFEIFNFSVNGYCTRHELELLRRYIDIYKPDLVYVVTTYFDGAGCFGMVQEVPRPSRPFLEGLFSHSSLFRYLTLRFDLFDFNQRISFSNPESRKVLPDRIRGPVEGFYHLCPKIIGSASGTASPAECDRAFNFFFNLKSFQERGRILENPENVGEAQVRTSLQQIKELCEKRHVRLIALLWPWFSSDAIRDRDLSGAYHAASEADPDEELLGSLGIPSHRLSRFFTAELRFENPRKELSVDGLHMSADGARRISRVFEKLVQRDLRER